MLCFISLDHWLYPLLYPSGFWAYQGNTHGKFPCSWFIISIQNSKIIKKWKQSMDNYWISRPNQGAHTYFWMDSLFKELYFNDSDFSQDWNKVPIIFCGAKGQSSMFAKKVLHYDKELMDIIYTNPPYAIKLSHHKFPVLNHEINNKVKHSNGYLSIQHSLKTIGNNITHKALYTSSDTDNKNIIQNFTVNCNDRLSDNFPYNIIKKLKHDDYFMILDSCNFCKDIHYIVPCRPSRV